MLRLCQKFVEDEDREAGEEAASYLTRSAELPGDVARNCLEILTGERKTPPIGGVVDRIVDGLLRESISARNLLARRLSSEPISKVFQEIYGLGDGSANALVTVLLDAAAWSKEADRETCEKGILQVGDYRPSLFVPRLCMSHSLMRSRMWDADLVSKALDG